MKQRVKERTEDKAIEDKATEDQCHHYWVIEIANGPKSRGVCKYCGEAKDFLNSISEFTVTQRKPNPLKLPRMPKVKMDDKSKS